MELSRIGNGSMITTLNGFGYAIDNVSDEYTDELIRFAAVSDGPIADLGCAFGYFTRAILKAGCGPVIANDLSEEHLKVLSESITDQKERDRLILMPGDAFKLKIEPNSLAGILVSHWLHFIKPEDVREAFKLFYSWLKPKGKLFVVTITTLHGTARDSQEVIAKRKSKGAEWPGWFENILYLDPEQLEREAKKAGFAVEKVGFIPRPELPQEFALDGRESAGLIAVKL